MKRIVPAVTVLLLMWFWMPAMLLAQAGEGKGKAPDPNATVVIDIAKAPEHGQGGMATLFGMVLLACVIVVSIISSKRGQLN